MPKLGGVLLPLLAAAVAASCCCAAAAEIGRVQLTHTGAGAGGLTGREALQSMAQRSKARAKRLLRRSASAPLSPGTPAGHDDPHTEYLLHFGIGTPAQPVQLTFDTGSDLTWTQCQPCQVCFDPALPHFAPSQSSTFGLHPCESGACQHLPFSSCGARLWGARRRTSSVPSQPFGCGFYNTGFFKSNETGIAGFGRGPLSLPSQSQLKLDNFSHCFTTNTFAAGGVSMPSSLLLDLPANLYGGTHGSAVQTTPLLQNPLVPTFCYLSLKGITVGRTRLPVPETACSRWRATGPAARSSTPDPRSRWSRRRSTGYSGPKICFTVAPGAKPEENYILKFQEAGHSKICVAVGEAVGPSMIGNFQQQNLHMLYDLANNKLSFVPAQCDKL
ncbi:unnamed protein product [Urochloa decumbens]|uniref:Peptidase A1 domain-containing protein n=1 Tax=Urochloa decumbens TaxID=240449 RepID=A0ABC9BQR0_9POAL